VTPESIEIICVTWYDNNYYAVSGNRRLYLYKHLQARSLLTTVPVNIVTCSDYVFNQNYTTTNRGRSIHVRGRTDCEQEVLDMIQEFITQRRKERQQQKKMQNRYWDQNMNAESEEESSDEDTMSYETNYGHNQNTRPAVVPASHLAWNSFDHGFSNIDRCYTNTNTSLPKPEQQMNVHHNTTTGNSGQNWASSSSSGRMGSASNSGVTINRSNTTTNTSLTKPEQQYNQHHKTVVGNNCASSSAGRVSSATKPSRPTSQPKPRESTEGSYGRVGSGSVSNRPVTLPHTPVRFKEEEPSCGFLTCLRKLFCFL
jgi:hypothetical protein